MARESVEERRARLQPGGDWLRAERERRGLTGKELGALTGVQQERISAYERAQDEPPTEFARALAKVFGISETEVWRGLGKPLPRELDPAEMTGPEVIAFVNQYWPGDIDVALGRTDAAAAPPTGGKPAKSVTRKRESG